MFDLHVECIIEQILSHLITCSSSFFAVMSFLLFCLLSRFFHPFSLFSAALCTTGPCYIILEHTISTKCLPACLFLVSVYLLVPFFLIFLFHFPIFFCHCPHHGALPHNPRTRLLHRMLVHIPGNVDGQMFVVQGYYSLNVAAVNK